MSVIIELVVGELQFVKADNLLKTEMRKEILLRQFRGELVPLATEVEVAA